MPKLSIHGKLLFYQWNPAQTLRFFQRDRTVQFYTEVLGLLRFAG
jgi:hypothetical protein